VLWIRIRIGLVSWGLDPGGQKNAHKKKKRKKVKISFFELLDVLFVIVDIRGGLEINI
jgi:hypothetical protein